MTGLPHSFNQCIADIVGTCWNSFGIDGLFSWLCKCRGIQQQISDFFETAWRWNVGGNSRGATPPSR